MGPRFFKRGEEQYAGDDITDPKASMGPRFFKRGETGHCRTITRRSTCFNGATLLQAWREYDRRGRSRKE